MRNLNVDELIDRITDDSTEIEFIDTKQLHSKYTHFWNLLESQPISKRTFERIEEDFYDLKEKIIQIDTSFNLCLNPTNNWT